MRPSRALLLCLATGAATGALWATLSDRPAARAVASPLPRCLVARLGGIEITARDAEQLAGLLSPPPSPSEASRLVVDAALADWLASGELVGSSPRRWLASYRDFLSELAPRAASPADLGRHAMADLDRAAAALHLATGPCYAALPPST